MIEAAAHESCRFPAEWESHDAVWLCWPYNESDWPGKLAAVKWDFADFVRIVSAFERVELLCRDEHARLEAEGMLAMTGVPLIRRTSDCHEAKFPGVRVHLLATDRAWLRDSAPTAVRAPHGGLNWVQWGFNAWAKYDDFALDAQVPKVVAEVSCAELIEAKRSDNGQPVVLEGGAIDTDGEGTLLVTEECLLSDVQCRNPGFKQQDYEEVFRRYLGIERVIWLARGIAGDDTHGHIDDVARFVAPGRILLAAEYGRNDEFAAVFAENIELLQSSADALGRKIEVIPLPLPTPVSFAGQRLPASYLNFYIANNAVLVPTFNDVHDRKALSIIADLFPSRRVIGVHSVNLIWGLGSLHCLTQQQPAA